MHVTRVAERRGAERVWWGNLRERVFGRPRLRWEDNIKMVLQEIDWVEGAWTESIWPRTGTSDGLL